MEIENLAVARLRNYSDAHANSLADEAFQAVKDVTSKSRRPFTGGTFAFIGDTGIGWATILVAEAGVIGSKAKPRKFIMYKEADEWIITKVK